MRNSAPANTPEESKTPQTHDTVQIWCDGLPAEQLREMLEALRGAGHLCTSFEGIEGARAALSDPRTKLLLFGSDDEEGRNLAEITRAASASTHDVPILVYCDHRVPADLDEVLSRDVDDFILGPLNIRALRLKVNRLTQRFTLQRQETERARQHLLAQFGMRQFIGNTPAFLTVLEKVQRIAACDVPVLLAGETGTGKEMCARAIHYLSPRADKPFIPVNCGAIPPELFENEMFGHESGAYTDARRSQRGLIAAAEGGMLFLDEVDSLPLTAQVKLLRFLQDRQYKSLGSLQYKQADTRVLTATNKNLQEKVRQGLFREDLLYRMKVISLELPPLRDRKEDILALANHFIETAAREYKRAAMRLSPGAAQKLLMYRWPGNVRELENVIRHAVVMCEGTTFRAQDLELNPEPQSATASLREPFNVAKARAVEAFERDYISEILAACDGNISRAAREAKKDRRAFFTLLKKHGMTSTKRQTFVG